MSDRSRIYINGAWVDSGAPGRIDVFNPATGDRIAVVAEGTCADVDTAVAAARAAFADWSERSGAERAGYLEKALSLVVSRMDDLAELICRDLGMPLELAKSIQVGLPAANLATFAELARAYSFDGFEVGNSLVVREPIGVVGAITPWNYPLHQIVLKVGAALAAGCTVVLKPSEVTPLIAYALADVFDETGLPPGVLNLVSGYGPVVGEAIAAHRDVDMVSFTGSTRAGKRVAVVAAETVKKVTLELGGKSAAIILEDAPLEEAVADTVHKCMLNSGQTCSALSRMLVPHTKIDEASAIAARVARQFTLGDPMLPVVRLGPLVSDAQRQRVERYIEQGVAEGAALVVDGRDDGHRVGHFVGATVFTNVSEDMTIAREEIFGPVLSIMGYHDEDDAVRIANDSEFGLAGSVWSASAERALRVARRMHAGQVQINDGQFNPSAPFGGFKQSGVGREGGTLGLEEFLEVKAIQR
ncbi:aldehyde dehydrogenase family protein [Streptomyces sp. NPDC051976]|uniref:aldehyde dehydrogenase family protein n=1 Tax=Streptomyces sp. NPDC051976 TaxID=3154947 RepID=UPI0034445CEA